MVNFVSGNKMVPALAVPPQTTTVNSGQLKGFQELLIRLDEGTVRWPIGACEDLLLDSSGKLQSNGFALSSLAYYQICNCLAAGLAKLTADIAGMSRRHNAYDPAVSLPYAIDTYNRCARLRFNIPNGVCSKEMVQNHVTKVVDGIVGPKYRYLANNQLLDATCDMLAAAESSMTFQSGLLIGRRMVVTYVKNSDDITTDDDQFLIGCYFTNSEAGECSVAGGLMLQLYGTNLRCLMPLQHLSHVGKSFTRKLGHLSDSVLEQMDAANDAVVKATERLDVPLGLNPASNKAIRSQCRRLAAKLSKHIDKAAARHIVRRAVFVEATGEPTAHPTATALKSRTARDVFIGLMKAAHGQHPRIREKLELAAFDVLSNKIQLTVRT